MINSKMWLVVKPTVGLPLFFGGVVVASLSIHSALLFNTDYFTKFLRGGTRPAAAEMVPQQTPARVALTGSTAVQAPADPSVAAAKLAILGK